MDSTYYFLSDLHLKNINDPAGIKLLKFLKEQWPKKPGSIFLLGDIFDLWVADHKYFQKKYKSLIDELKSIKQKDFEIYYFEGNHDLHLRKFWEMELGFKVITDYLYLDLHGVTFRLEHGDLINKKDLSYLKLRQFLRNDYMTSLAYKIPGFIVGFIGEKWSAKSRKKSYQYLASKNEEIKNMIRSHAQESFKQEPFHFIITGHMHVKDDFTFEVNHQEVRSINLGSWITDASVLKIDISTAEVIVDWIIV